MVLWGRAPTPSHQPGAVRWDTPHPQARETHARKAHAPRRKRAAQRTHPGSLHSQVSSGTGYGPGSGRGPPQGLNRGEAFQVGEGAAAASPGAREVKPELCPPLRYRDAGRRAPPHAHRPIRGSISYTHGTTSRSRRTHHSYPHHSQQSPHVPGKARQGRHPQHPTFRAHPPGRPNTRLRPVTLPDRI